MAYDQRVLLGGPEQNFSRPFYEVLIHSKIGELPCPSDSGEEAVPRGRRDGWGAVCECGR